MHRFIDFKGFRDAGLNLFRPVTLLVGKNASGKTNAIEGVELLANLAHGRPLHEVTDIGRGGPGTFEVRGGIIGCPRSGTTRFGLGFDGGTIRFDGHSASFSYTIHVDTTPHSRIVAESLVVGARVLFEAQTRSPTDYAILDVHYDNFAQGGNKPHAFLPADRSVLSRYGDFTAHLKERQGRPAERHKQACTVTDTLGNYLRASFVFDPAPRTMRAYERVGQRALLRDGSNLSSVLFALSQGDASDVKTLKRILERIRQLPEEPFADFDFIVTRQQDVLLAVKETEDGPPVDARVMSDGTLRSLAVLTALETVAQGSRIIIEEFDNGVHPSRVQILAEAVWECAKRRKLNALVTTHNPATLDALTDEQIMGVVLCFRDSGQQASRLVPLLELPRADVLLERGHLGDLVTRQTVDKYLAPDFEAHYKKQALEWLDTLAR